MSLVQIQPLWYSPAVEATAVGHFKHERKLKK